MSVPADGQPPGLDYLPSRQEAATSAAWVRRPSLEGDKTWQSLNALMERTEERREEGEEVAGADTEKTRAGGRRKAGKDYVFFQAGRRKIERCAGREEKQVPNYNSELKDRYSCPPAKAKNRADDIKGTKEGNDNSEPGNESIRR